MASRLDPLVFFGTPDFALPTLQALVAAGRAPVLVVAQPDRRAGRGQGVQAPAVARWAREHGLPLAQPEKVRDPAFVDRLRELAPAVAVVVAFGQIFPRALLDVPRHGCVNVHASLLPRHRGAAPVQAAILAGDRETGVCTMVMEEGLDSGPVLLAARTALSGRETAGELAPRLAHLGAALLLETLARLEAGTLAATPQEHALATVAPRIRKEEGRLDWSRPAAEIDARIRAFTPWPGAFGELRGEPLKVLAAQALDGGHAGGGAGEPAVAPLAAASGAGSAEAIPGTVLGIRGEALAVACGDGTALGLLTLQRPGRRPLPAAVFANGERLSAGERLA
jgi:methionyl-tRNA formyltransferase